MSGPPPTERVYLTGDLPPVRGRTREQPEDFVVAEVPLYEPCGEGEHLYVEIEKRGVSTHEAVRLLANALGASPRAIGYAGLKDAKAITRQTLSIGGGVDAEALAALDDDDRIRVLSAARHRNKLKVGHLAGNRFRIRMRGVDADGADRAERVLERLARSGVPNYFGLQRFGFRRNTHRLGAALVRNTPTELLAELVGRPQDHESEACQEARRRFDAGDVAGARELFPPSFAAERAALAALAKQPDALERAVRAIPKKMRGLYASAYQSELFNRYLSRVLAADEDAGLPRFDRLGQGEVATLHRNGAAFLVTDPEREATRVAAIEISPSGPIFGTKLLRPLGGPARELEDAILAEEGLDGAEGFAALAPLGLKGERRPLRFAVSDVSVEREDDAIVLAFGLPKGCYATAVLEEIAKAPVA